jgi:ribosomal-protein-alanine N-acetyltransferase
VNAIFKPRLQNQNLKFRPMLQADLSAVMLIEPEIYPYPWSRGNFSDSLNSGYSCLVLERNGAIIGYAVLMMVLDEAHLLNISIAKPQQGSGLGRALLAHMVQVARTHGALNMFLEVRPSNLTAIRLYESIGFNEMAVRKGYYPAKNGRENAILMGMAL